MLFCELGQARKGAAVAKDTCARMWLEIYHPISPVNAQQTTVYLNNLPVFPNFSNITYLFINN